jgi:hypothetical protein
VNHSEYEWKPREWKTDIWDNPEWLSKEAPLPTEVCQSKSCSTSSSGHQEKHFELSTEMEKNEEELQVFVTATTLTYLHCAD